MSQHINHFSAGVFAQAPTLWRTESSPGVFALCSQKQPSFVLCTPQGTAAAQPVVGWVCSIAEPQENGITPKQFLKLSTDSFVSFLVRTGNNVSLQRQLLTWASFQAQWKQDKPGWGTKTCTFPVFAPPTFNMGERAVLSQDKPMVPTVYTYSSSCSICTHLSLSVRTTSNSLQTGVSGPARPEGWPPSIRLYCLGVH